jgi:hypothetical protein
VTAAKPRAPRKPRAASAGAATVAKKVTATKRTAKKAAVKKAVAKKATAKKVTARRVPAAKVPAEETASARSAAKGAASADGPVGDAVALQTAVAVPPMPGAHPVDSASEETGGAADGYNGHEGPGLAKASDEGAGGTGGATRRKAGARALRGIQIKREGQS